jgi:GTP cyclohydrolase I
MAPNDQHPITWDAILERLRALPSGLYYGVPRGGAVIAGLLHATNHKCSAVDSPEKADFILDDLIDSGRTRAAYAKYGKPFLALFDKQTDPAVKGRWLVFPYEGQAEQDIEDSVVRQLEFIGEDPNREGLKATPARVVRAWSELYGGYKKDPAEILRTFSEGACDEMVVLKGVDFYSTCEHHMMPFFGTASVGYVPKGRVLGISKVARLVEIFARRLQIQERLTTQVAEALAETLNPLGVMVVVKAQHLCMMARGVAKQNAIMTTSHCIGLFREDLKARDEFLKLISQ